MNVGEPVIVHDPWYGDQECHVSRLYDDGAVEATQPIPGDSRSLIYTISAEQVSNLVSLKYP